MYEPLFGLTGDAEIPLLFRNNMESKSYELTLTAFIERDEMKVLVPLFFLVSIVQQCIVTLLPEGYDLISKKLRD